MSRIGQSPVRRVARVGLVSIALRLAAAVAGLSAAGCTSSPPPPATTSQPAAPSWEAVLDKGGVTPIEAPILVTVKPFASAYYEETEDVTVLVAGHEDESTLRMIGRMAGESAGGFVAITTVYDQAGTTGTSDTLRKRATTYRRATIRYVVDSQGRVRDKAVTLPSASADHDSADPYRYEVHNPENETCLLPAEGISQGQVLELTVPAERIRTSGSYASAYRELRTARGRGLYRGRAVIAFDITASIVLEGGIMDIRGYGLLDVKTGVWSRIDLVSSHKLGYGTFSTPSGSWRGDVRVVTETTKSVSL